MSQQVAEELHLTLQSRQASTASGEQTEITNTPVVWNALETAVIVCDMWDVHWCRSASRRVDEMAPRMNAVLTALRSKGVFIIHAPSDTLEFYDGTPQRLRAQIAPHSEPIADMRSWRRIDPDREPPLPVDDSDGGCDDETPCPQSKAWSRQHPVLEIAPEDAITDSGQEVYNLCAARNISNIIIMGVHTNMCVLGRSFGIRSLVHAGKKVALARDLTDALYNPRMHPHVSHEEGTQLILAHIERFWCPTVSSADLV